METSKTQKKKKTHFFETYILKVLKQISEISNITSNAKQQINSFLCIFSKHVSRKIIELTIVSKKKTISDKEVSNSLKIILCGELLNNSLSEGEKAVNTFKNFKDESETPGEKNILCRQNKAGIIFPPSLVEKFLRQFGYNKIMITGSAPIYLAAVLEYITFEILDLANNYCIENKRVRITIRDIELAIRTDEELDRLFLKLNINLLGGGVVPFIHSSLLNKNSKKPLKNKESRRFHSGTVSIRNIKKQQKFSDSLIFARLSFEKFVRQIFRDNKYDEKIKISKDVFIALQYFIEQYIVNILKNANLLVIHAGRVKLLPVDIGLISYFNNNSKNPYSETLEESIEILSINSNTSPLNE
jgi:histone H2A